MMRSSSGSSSKYKDLKIEIEKMWYLKTTTVPVILGALGMIRKGTNKNITKIPSSPSLIEIQKIVLDRIAHHANKINQSISNDRNDNENNKKNVLIYHKNEIQI